MKPSKFGAGSYSHAIYKEFALMAKRPIFLPTPTQNELLKEVAVKLV
jgi:hypothetical protein